MNGIRISLLAAVCIVNSFAEEIKLNEVTVSTTAFGQEQSITDVQASIQVLDQKVIKSTSGRTTAQVLNEAIGLEVKDGGSTTNVSIRGFSEDHTLILVDGLRRTGKYGSSDISGISLEDIERIEIVRGPMSALYGSDAMGGVVNIITKEASKETTAKVSILGGIADNGERETGIVRATVNVGGETISHIISAETTERGDYREDKDSIATDLRRESHQFASYGNTIKFGEDTLRTRLEFSKQDDEGMTEGRFGGIDTHEKEKRYHASAVYNHVNEDYVVDANFGYGYSDTNVNRGSGDETTEYSQTEANVYLRHFTTDNMINIIGISARYEDIDVSMYSQTADRENYSALYQNEWSITENLSTVIGVRYDDFSDFGDTTNPRVSAQYDLDDVYFRTGYGESFKAPAFTNMYGSFYRGGGTLWIHGNPDLDPETSKTFELATGYAVNDLTLDLVYHHTKFDDLIDSYYVSRTEVTYTNIAKAKIEGVELSTIYHPTEEIGINASLEYLDTEDEETGERLPNSAKYTAKVRLSYEHVDTGYFLNFKSYRDYKGVIEGTRPAQYDEDINYHVIDLKVTHSLNETLELSAGIDNIQNNKMEYGMELFGTPNDPGERYYYVGLTAQF